MGSVIWQRVERTAAREHGLAVSSEGRVALSRQRGRGVSGHGPLCNRSGLRPLVSWPSDVVVLSTSMNQFISTYETCMHVYMCTTCPHQCTRTCRWWQAEGRTHDDLPAPRGTTRSTLGGALARGATSSLCACPCQDGNNKPTARPGAALGRKRGSLTDIPGPNATPNPTCRRTG